MLEFFYQLDVKFFYFINHTLSNPVFDKIFPFLTDLKNWNLVYIIFFLILIIYGKRIGRISAIATIFLILVSDQVSSHLLKNLFARIRPCNVLDNVNLLVSCTESFSFPSSHAVNNFAAAVFFSIIFPRYKVWFYTIATLLAFSRPYVGVHYPSDVIGGALIGSLIGYIFALIVLRINKALNSKEKVITERYKKVELK